MQMHEFSLVSDLIETLTEEMRKRNATAVDEVRLEVGELSSYGIDQLRAAYESLTQGTPLEGSTLILDVRKAVVECTECGYRGGVSNIPEGHHHDLPIAVPCPACQSPVKVVEGAECKLMEYRLRVD